MMHIHNERLFLCVKIPTMAYNKEQIKTNNNTTALLRYSLASPLRAKQSPKTKILKFEHSKENWVCRNQHMHNINNQSPKQRLYHFRNQRVNKY